MSKVFVVTIRKIGDENYCKLVGTRYSLKKAEQLEERMLSRINDNYYINIEELDYKTQSKDKS